MKINTAIDKLLSDLKSEGRYKSPERVVLKYNPAQGEKGPRFFIEGQGDKEFIRTNSNDYLGLSLHPKVINAGENAAKKLGANAGGVRFISGTTKYHIDLEKRLAKFHNKEAAKVFSCAYMANLGIALAIMNQETYVLSDQLNHNSIARAIRIAGVQKQNKGFYKHNDMESLKNLLENIPSVIKRVVIIFDGIFSMRGDYAPIFNIIKLAKEFNDKFEDGVITIVDDSHGTAAYGNTGRGTPQIANGDNVDIIVSTLGKGFGAEGGYVATSSKIIELVRQKSDTYIYTNPISPGGAASALTSINIVDSSEGLSLLQKTKENANYFREKIQELGYEIIKGVHPIVPIMIRDTLKANKIVDFLFEKGILVVGIIYPIVPKGDECIRIQINASHTKEDVNYVLNVFKEAKTL